MGCSLDTYRARIGRFGGTSIRIRKLEDQKSMTGKVFLVPEKLEYYSLVLVGHNSYCFKVCRNVHPPSTSRLVDTEQRASCLRQICSTKNFRKMAENNLTQSETFSCTVQGCKKILKTKNGINSHMNEKHQPQGSITDNITVTPAPDTDGQDGVPQDSLDDEDEVMEEWKSIFDELDKIGEVYDTDDKKDEVEAMIKKLERIRSIVQKKAVIIKDLRSETKQLKDKVDKLKAGPSACHDCTLKDEVADHKEAMIVQKEAVIARKEKENKELKKTMENQRKTVNKLKLNYEKSIEENNELKTKVDEQEDNIKHLEEQCGIDVEYEICEVETIGIRNSMNRNSSGHLCVTCDQTFATNNGLEKRIKNKNTELWCDHCGTLFRNKAELNKHMENCDELGMEATECKKWNKKW